MHPSVAVMARDELKVYDEAVLLSRAEGQEVRMHVFERPITLKRHSSTVRVAEVWLALVPSQRVNACRDSTFEPCKPYLQ